VLWRLEAEAVLEVEEVRARHHLVVHERDNFAAVC
jgi:hypothetical protein